MNIGIESSDFTPADMLSYDDNVAYDDHQPVTEPVHTQLADRIGNTKVYLLPEATDSPYRDNAILFRGTPISHLSTASIKEYATHYDSHPMALEWIDDITCILVFDTKAVARSALRHLTKSIAEEPSAEDGSVTAKPIPVAIWPPEERINKSLGKGEGLKGAIRMRWATRDDIKKKGAKKESEFYRKYGSKAGKLIGSEVGALDRDDEPQRKRRREDPLDKAVQMARLDDELDAFLAEDDAPQELPSPPSKMRSDHMVSDRKSLLQRTSVMRARPDTLASRITAELPRRARSHRHSEREDDHRTSLRRLPQRDRRDHREDDSFGGRGRPRPHKTQQDLDDELEAFLKERE
ncbi:predicted protein [Postia placenta Mad-698-R]|uniref:Chromatin target of PRMT1 protein C-terminal domain-containing protein n=1 Tax=Postia placenta MAD-698-R-SB12 TaxID=670580 RepID=A0A1X6MW42_9APHY|nr:hypothetical protein POSPLADRAFT_1058756 [Postia placenta MAD-698-R-SB12]EED84387.1 predicted protein [Postia placenta Mad-698-R]OSX60587.1 hypothetical protein POSPLADRAFT_1058756 [Postia placenta MAD-698-R-SB12]